MISEMNQLNSFPTKIKTDSGEVVELAPSQLERAIRGALLTSGLILDSSLIDAVIAEVAEQVQAASLLQPVASSSIQGLIESTIDRLTVDSKTPTYLVYQEEIVQSETTIVETSAVSHEPHRSITHESSLDSEFNAESLTATVIKYAHEYGRVINKKELVDEVMTSLFDGITAKEVNQALVMSARARIERDPAYSSLAARFVLRDVYQEVLKTDEFDENFIRMYRDTFSEKVRRGVETERLDARMLDFDFVRLAKALAPERDKLFAYLGLQTLYERYLLRTSDREILETPQYFWMRVAMGLSLNEPDKEASALEFYRIISQLLYVPSTPTLFHSGTTHPQMSSCYLTTIEDDLSHIFKCIGDNAQLSKWSGGIGNDWSNVRATNAMVKSINVGSQGVIPFLKIVDSTTASINRSGKRRGATCVYLETWHYDVEDFLELRKNTGDERRRTHDINTANWIPDLFMKRVLSDDEWTLFSPEETPDLHHLYGKAFEKAYVEYEKKADNGEIRLYKKVRANELWRKMVTMLFETGHPWMTFKDPCNIRSPQDHVGVVHSSNLCTEITLNTSAEETAVCNLGSVNLVRHIEDGKLDRTALAVTVKTAMRMLDNVIDLNFYPTKEAQTANFRHRPVGLGMMGYQDALYALGMGFESDEALAFSDGLMEFISYHAIAASSELAKERGAYSSFKGSKWDRNLLPIDTLALLEEERGVSTGVEATSHLDWAPVRDHIRQYGMRNSNCLAIAPTATIANIAGCLPSIEPIFKNLYVKSNQSGEFTIMNRNLVEDLKLLNLWNPEMLAKVKYFDGSVQQIEEIPAEIRAEYKEVFEIDPVWIVKHAAYRGKWIDQSQSVNIFTASESGKLISDVYLAAWKMGLKTTYYLRTLGASGIEKSTLDINKKYDQEGSVAQANGWQAEEDVSITETIVVAETLVEEPEQDWAAAQIDPPVKMCLLDDPTCESCQ